MNVVKILGKSGRIELVDLASLLLPVSAMRLEKNESNDEGSEEDCEGCEGDEEECVRCGLRNILHEVD